MRCGRRKPDEVQGGRERADQSAAEVRVEGSDWGEKDPAQ
jgi:hypothetical protein